MTFQQLIEARNWKPIRNCPGRFVLHGAKPDLRLEELAGVRPSIEHRINTARDVVLVTPLDGGGGLISYKRDDGSFLHTLNTPEGFHRKLAQLGIIPPYTAQEIITP